MAVAQAGSGGGVDHSGDQFRAALSISDLEEVDPELAQAAAKIDASEESGDAWGQTDGYVSLDEFSDSVAAGDVDISSEQFDALQAKFEGDGEARAGSESYEEANKGLVEQEYTGGPPPPAGYGGAGDETNESSSS